MPRSNLKSFAFSSRIDICKFASLADFLRRNGLTELTQSSVTRAIFEMLFAHLDKTDSSFRIFESAIEAKDFLDSTGITIGRDNRAYGSFLRQVQEEALLDDFGTTDYLTKHKVKADDVDSCELGEAMKILQDKTRERDKEFKEQQKELLKGDRDEPTD